MEDNEGLKLLLKRFCVRLGVVLSKDNEHCSTIQKFTEEELVSFLEESLAAFNAFPPFTYNKLSDFEFCDTHSHLLVQYAVYVASLTLAIKYPDFYKYNPPVATIGDTEFERWFKLIEEVKTSVRYYDHWVKDDDE